MPEPELRCYICGEPLGTRLALVALTAGVDRVFVMHWDKCRLRVEQPATIIEVVRPENI